MQRFIQKHAADVIGVLNGFDRMRFRGTLRWLANPKGMRSFLYAAGVLLKHFKEYVTGVTERIRAATARLAESHNRPLVYLDSSAVRKEQKAREIAQQDGIQQGLICVLTCVEPCFSYEVSRNRQQQRLELRGGTKKCLHHYFYFQDPQFGFMHLRLQTWFPFSIHVCLNGREWLARQMDAAGLRYRRRENCFVALEDPEKAQRLFDRQLKTPWKTALERLRRQVHPTHDALFRQHPIPYYWSLDESEWATDILFRTPQALAALYPHLLTRAVRDFSSAEVMRFLGHRVPAHGGVNGNFQGEVVSDVTSRHEGVRIKHRVNRNSIKMYDKQGSVLRVETTINNTREMKVYRRVKGQGTRKASRRGKGQGKTPLAWQRLRKGVADIHRRAQISQAANQRYLDQLTDVDTAQSLGALTESLCRPTAWRGRRVRALQPWSAGDVRLLEAVSRPEFALQGFRNRDLRPLLYDTASTARDDDRRRSAKTSRQLRLLRAHGLIAKIAHTHRYQLTARARTVIPALLAARRANPQQLTQLAA
jgi:hypothetical protein